MTIQNVFISYFVFDSNRYFVEFKNKVENCLIFTDFFTQLKPELIAPVVFWLCHENCAENGSIIESALGWAGKCEYRIFKK